MILFILLLVNNYLLNINHLKVKLSRVLLKHLTIKNILVVLLPEHCMLKSLVLFLLLHIILGIMNNGSFLVQLTGKLISAYVKSLVTVILLVPHCLLT